MEKGEKIYNTGFKIFIAALFIFSISTLTVSIWDPDFWWHLATGKWMVDHGRLQESDPFSFATIPKDPYFPVERVRFILTQSWLAEIIMYKVYSVGGFAGISIMRSLLMTISLFILYLLLRFHKMEPWVIALTMSCAYLIFALFTNERPQQFSNLLAALLLYILEISRHRRLKYAVLLIPMMALWSNLHGGYIYGGVIIWIYIISGWISIFIRGDEIQQKKRHLKLTLILILAFISSFANPNLFQAYVNTAVPQLTNVSRYIQEYKPAYSSFKDHLVLFFVVSVTPILMAINRRRVDITELSLFAFNAVISIMSIRYIVFFAFYGSFVFGRYLDYTARSLITNRKGFFGTVAIITTVCLFTVYVVFVANLNPSGILKTSVNYSEYPRGATAFIRDTLPPKRLFNPYTWGGFLIWHLYPRFQVFIDGRNLNPEIFFQSMEVMRADSSETYFGLPKWKAILEGYNIDYVIVGPLKKYSHGVRLVEGLVNSDDWELVFVDNDALVFIRNKEEFRNIIDRYSVPKEFAYGTVASQALENANYSNDKEKVESYLIATDAFVRLKKVESARYALKKAYEISPDNINVKAWIEALGMESEIKR